MRRFLFAFILMASSSAVAVEPVPGVKPLSDGEVRKAVEALGSRDYRERERASQALAGGGEKVLPQLKAGLDKSEAPEVQRRLEVLIAKVKSERLMRPSLVSVDCKNASLKTILEDLCQQAGYKFSDGGGTDPSITLKRTNVPFWEAMTAISDLSGLTIQPQDDVGKGIYAYGNESSSPHESVTGPFRFTASNISSSRSVQLSNIARRGRAANPEYIGMGVQICAEPKTPLVGIGEVTLVKAVDDKGHSLVPPIADENRRTTRLYVPGNYRSLSQSCSIALVRGHRDAAAIRELEAKVAVAILVEERPEITVEKLLDANKKKFAGTSLDLELDEVTEAMGGVSFKITFRQRDANPDDYNWSNTAMQRVVVLDEHGARMASNGCTEQTNAPGIAVLHLSFSAAPGGKAGKPAKLILNEWITETREIAFKFKDVPLP